MERTRKSRSAKADVSKDASINSPINTGFKLTKTPIANQKSYSEMLDEIFECPINTPRKKKENLYKEKLNDHEILQKLDLSDEESYSGKDWICVPVPDTIKLKLITLETEYDFMIGAKEKKKSVNKSSETPRKLRRTMGVPNYHEDALMDKHERDCIDNINSATPSRTHKNNTQATNQVVESSPRKRTKQNTEQEFEQYDVDKNEMSQANQITSPPKRPKSGSEIKQTPKKNSLLEQRTPRSAAKRKILEESENKLEREPKVVLDYLYKTKQSSKNVQTSESGESEIENKMNNANENSIPKNTRSRSKSIQAPVKTFREQIYSPTKDMRKLNINENVETPTSSGRLLNAKSLLSTPSSTQKSNAEKQNNARRKSQRIAQKGDLPKYSEITTLDESADSSDNYKGEEESSDSEEDQSFESGNDSANEFKESRRRKKNLKTPRKNPATPKTRKKLTKVSMDTPTKAISRMSIGTPTFDKHRRTISISKPSTPLQKARVTLHVSILPKSLPCREEQFNDIYSFLHARLSDGSGGCIYISGVPGTGKTATVSEVIRCLKKSMAKGELSDFDYIDINGMKLSEPRQAYVQIWKQMTGQTKTWEESHKLLQNKFNNSNSKRKMTLLLVDELDLLCTKRQDVVYNLLDWPSKVNAKLVVVTIANTMDLPERILMGKVTSRLGLTRLTFPPYNFKQLEEIVASRLKGENAFGGETIQLVARKVAAVSGDARRALDICRRAAEIAENNGRELVSMIDVKQALDEMIASPKIQAIKHCSDMEKYFLQAVCTEVQRTGVEEVVFKNVYMQMETLCSLDGLKAPNISEALEMCARLGSWRLLLCDHSRMDIHQRLLLNVSTDDVYFATKEINE